MRWRRSLRFNTKKYFQRRCSTNDLLLLRGIANGIPKLSILRAPVLSFNLLSSFFGFPASLYFNNPNTANSKLADEMIIE